MDPGDKQAHKMILLNDEEDIIPSIKPYPLYKMG